MPGFARRTEGRLKGAEEIGSRAIVFNENNLRTLVPPFRLMTATGNLFHVGAAVRRVQGGGDYRSCTAFHLMAKLIMGRCYSTAERVSSKKVVLPHGQVGRAGAR